MNKWITVLTIMITVIGEGQTIQRLTLGEAIRNGQEKSKLLSISSSKVENARAKSTEAHAGLLPSLKFSGAYARLSDVPPFQIQPPGFPNPITIAPTVLDNYNLRVSLEQPIFTGFRLSSNASAAEHFAQASESDFQNDKDDVILNTTVAYWSLYQTMETKKFFDENVVRLQTYRKDTENLMKAGMATRNDLLKIGVQLSSAQLAQIDATNDVQVAMMNLNNVMGQPVENEIECSSSPQETTMVNTAETLSGLEEKAFASRPDLQAMQSRIEASKAGVAVAQGNYLPQLFLIGNYYYNRPNVRYQPTIDEFKTSWDVGIQLQLDLWNWGATASEVDQAKSTLAENRSIYEQMRDNIVLEVKRNYLSVQRAKDKIAVAKLSIDQAEENTRTTGDKYRSGVATSSELLDADTALLQVKTNYTGALVEQELAIARLRRSVGGWQK